MKVEATYMARDFAKFTEILGVCVASSGLVPSIFSGSRGRCGGKGNQTAKCGSRTFDKLNEAIRWSRNIVKILAVQLNIE
jgi:hypothetical protein